VFIGQYGLQGIPLYAVILGAILFGIFVSWIISLVGLISTSLALRSKDGKIRDAETQTSKYEERIHELELENERLRGEGRISPAAVEEHIEHTSLNPFVKIRQRFS
jgi:hypothetical protein